MSGKLVDIEARLEELIAAIPWVAARRRRRLLAIAAGLSPEARARWACCLWKLRRLRHVALRRRDGKNDRPVRGNSPQPVAPTRSGQRIGTGGNAMEESKTRLEGWGAPVASRDSAAATVKGAWQRRVQRVVERCCLRCSLWEPERKECVALTGRRPLRATIASGDMRCNPRDLIREALVFLRYVYQEERLPEKDGDTLETWTDHALAVLGEVVLDPQRLPFRDARLLLSIWVPRFLLRWGRTLRAAARPENHREEPLTADGELGRAVSSSPVAATAALVVLRPIEAAHHRLQRIHPLLALLVRCGLEWEPEPEPRRREIRNAYGLSKSALSKREADAHFRLAVLYERALEPATLDALGRRILHLREFDEERQAAAPHARHEWNLVAERLGRQDLPAGTLLDLRNETAAGLIDELLEARPGDQVLRAILHYADSVLRAGVGVDKFEARRPGPRPPRGGASGGRDTREASMQDGSGDHPDDETLYRYGAGLLGGCEEEIVGAHLLTCRNPLCHRLAAAGVLLGHRLEQRLAPPSLLEELRRLLPERAFVDWRMLAPVAAHQRGAALSGLRPETPLELAFTPAGITGELQAATEGAPLVIAHAAREAPFIVVHPTPGKAESVCLRWNQALRCNAGTGAGRHRLVVLALPDVPTESDIAALAAAEGLAEIVSVLDAAARTPLLALLAEYSIEEGTNG